VFRFFTGVYEICIDNSFSRFSTKLVYFYLVTYSVKDWEKYAKDVENLEMEMSIGNFSVSILINTAVKTCDTSRSKTLPNKV
jgi:hypothetical protein